MNVKKFLAQPGNFLNLGSALLFIAQINYLLAAFRLDSSRELFVWIQTAFLLGTIVNVALYARRRRRDPYPVDARAAKAVFSSFAMLALLSLSGYWF